LFYKLLLKVDPDSDDPTMRVDPLEFQRMAAARNTLLDNTLLLDKVYIEPKQDRVL